jgi:hypothetical protein
VLKAHRATLALKDHKEVPEPKEQLVPKELKVRRVFRATLVE